MVTVRDMSVTRHAIDQLRKRGDARFPDAVTIRLDCVTAFREGRTSTVRPAFLEPGRPFGNASRIRFAWVPTATRAYVLRREADGWVVLTTLAASSNGEQEAA